MTAQPVRDELIGLQDQKLRFLRANSIFAALPPASQSQLCEAADIERFDRLVRIPVSRHEFLLVGRGLVIQETRFREHSLVTTMAGPGETVLLHEAMVDASIEASLLSMTSNTAVMFIKAAALIDSLERCGQAALALARTAGDAQAKLTTRLLHAAFAQAPARIAFMIFDLEDRFGDIREDGTSFIPIQLRRGDLAMMAGITVETLIRIAGKWKKDGLMSFTDDGIEIYKRDDLLAVTKEVA